MEQNFEGKYDNDDESLWDKIWRDDEGNVVIFSWPNVWLIAWAAVSFISVVSPTRGLSNITWWIGSVLLAIWALLEIFQGVNYFRRAFGVVIFLLNLFMAIRSLM